VLRLSGDGREREGEGEERGREGRGGYGMGRSIPRKGILATALSEL